MSRRSEERLLTTTEATRLFGVDRDTVAVWARAGRLPATKTPGGQFRFRLLDIERLRRAPASDLDDEQRGGT
jgi:excisionase family DNA binding protein